MNGSEIFGLSIQHEIIRKQVGFCCCYIDSFKALNAELKMMLYNKREGVSMYYSAL